MSSKESTATGMQQPRMTEELIPFVKQIEETQERNAIDVSAVSKENHEIKLEVKQKHLLSRFEKLFPANINRKLIHLKIALFCFFGGSAAAYNFVSLHFKQLGLTVSELSIIYTILPLTQFFVSATAGVIADKIGRSKPVLLSTLLLVMIFVTSMLFVPSYVIDACPKTEIHLFCCHQNPEAKLEGRGRCGIPRRDMKPAECNLQCSEDANKKITEYCAHNDDILCDILSPKKNATYLFISIVSQDEVSKNTLEQCSYDVDLWHVNKTSSKNATCEFIQLVRECNFTCFLNFTAQTQPWNSECKKDSKDKVQLFVISLFLIIMYSTTLSVCYQFFDVTAVLMIRSNNSNYGQQRFWSITGILVFSPVAGYIVDATSTTGSPKNYHYTFIILDVMFGIVFLIVWILDVEIASPGKQMWKKSITLLKNIEVVVFILIVFVLGTLWGFTTIFSFWYLEGLHAPSILLGFLPAVASITGLPFLMTSYWWLAKFGSKTLLIMGFMSYVVFCVGYAFLVNPWWAVIYQFTQIFSYHLLWVAVVTKAAELAPEGLWATTMTTTAALHYCVGKGSGSLVGGQIMSRYGARTAYQVMAIASATVAALYASYLLLRSVYLKKRQARNS